MLRRICVICLWLVTVSAFGQSAAKYQVGTITGVKPHQAQGDAGNESDGYDVSVTVGSTTYVVLYKPPVGSSPVKYAAGRNVLVTIGETTLRYNNIVGESLEVPIISRQPTGDAQQTK
jgi:hypothetical protein